MIVSTLTLNESKKITITSKGIKDQKIILKGLGQRWANHGLGAKIPVGKLNLGRRMGIINNDNHSLLNFFSIIGVFIHR